MAQKMTPQGLEVGLIIEAPEEAPVITETVEEEKPQPKPRRKKESVAE